MRNQIYSPKNLTSLVIMIFAYSKNGELDEVVKRFDKTKDERNSETWNLIIKFMWPSTDYLLTIAQPRWYHVSIRATLTCGTTVNRWSTTIMMYGDKATQSLPLVEEQVFGPLKRSTCHHQDHPDKKPDEDVDHGIVRRRSMTVRIQTTLMKTTRSPTRLPPQNLFWQR